MMHYWIRFKKQGLQKYISHRDMLRVFTRALRRARLPVALSQGFNPHLLISFSPPIELGVASRAEHMAIKLTESMPVETIIAKLNAALPDGLEMTEGMEVPCKVTSLMSWVETACYRVDVTGEEPERLKGALQALLDAETIVRSRRTKRSVKDVDLRPWIYQLDMTGSNTFTVCLRTGQNGNLKISQFMSLLPDFGCGSDLLWSAERLAIYGTSDNERATPLMLLKDLKERRETIGK